MYKYMTSIMDKISKYYPTNNILLYSFAIPIGIYFAYETFCFTEDMLSNYIKNKGSELLCDIIMSDNVNDKLTNYLNHINNVCINNDEFKLSINTLIKNSIHFANEDAETRKEISKLLKNQINKILLDDTTVKNIKNVTKDILQSEETIESLIIMSSLLIDNNNMSENLNVVCDKIISNILDNEQNKHKFEQYIMSIVNNDS